MDLFGKPVPKRVVMDVQCQRKEFLLGKLLVDFSGSDTEVYVYFSFGHGGSVPVQIIAFTFLWHDMQDGLLRYNGDAQDALSGVVGVRLLYIWIVLHQLFYL